MDDSLYEEDLNDIVNVLFHPKVNRLIKDYEEQKLRIMKLLHRAGERLCSGGRLECISLPTRSMRVRILSTVFWRVG